MTFQTATESNLCSRVERGCLTFFLESSPLGQMGLGTWRSELTVSYLMVLWSASSARVWLRIRILSGQSISGQPTWPNPGSQRASPPPHLSETRADLPVIPPSRWWGYGVVPRLSCNVIPSSSSKIPWHNRYIQKTPNMPPIPPCSASPPSRRISHTTEWPRSATQAMRTCLLHFSLSELMLFINAWWSD